MATDTDRGALVFQVKPGHENLGAGALMLVGGAALYYFFPWGREKFVGLVLLVISPYFLCYGTLNWFTIFRCFERGIEFNGRYIAFEELTSISARIYTIKNHGVRTKTTKLRIDGSNSEGPLTIRIKISELANKSAKGDHVVQKVSAAIVDQMKEALRTTGVAHCANLATLAADSMMLHASGREIAYRNIVAVRLVDALFRGDLLIRTADGFKAKFKLTDANAYPLYYLLRSLVPAKANAQTNAPSVYERSSSGFFLVLSFGLFALAAAFLVLPLLVPVPGAIRLISMIVISLIASGSLFLWLGLRTKK
jgi:hypothetical protein